jgi:hypothetical protein
LPDTGRSAELEVMPERTVSDAPQTLIPGLLELGAELRPNRTNPIGAERLSTDAFAAACEAALRPDLEPPHAAAVFADAAAASSTDVVAVAFDIALPASYSALPQASLPEVACFPAGTPDTSVAAAANTPAESVAPADHSAMGPSASHPVGAVVSPADATVVVPGAATPSALPAEEMQSEALLRKLLHRLQLRR